MSRLAISGVTKRYGATVALDGVDLEVRAGEIHALVGENGAGKSTLMKVLSGAVPPDAGELRLDDARYAPATPRAGRAAGVAMVYQELSLAPHMSVLDNIVLGREPAHWGGWLARRAARQRACEALSLVGLAPELLAVPAHRLPLAEQQLVEIARALAFGSRLLVLDEPTSSLALPDAERLLALLRRLRDDGLAVVYISHALEEVLALADRYTVLRDGRVVTSGQPVAGTRADDLVSAMVGRELDVLYPRSPRQPAEVVLELDELAGRERPRHASLQLRRGEVLGIAGLIGAGRSELLRAVFGLDPIARGRVSALGLAGPQPPWRRWAQGMGMVSEARAREGLALSLPIEANVVLPSLRGLGPAGTVRHGRAAAAATLACDALGVRAASVQQPVRDLSGGNQQKVALARLLHAGVDVLLLDEPTRGVDVGAKAEIYRWIDGAAVGDAEAGRPRCAVLMVSSYLPELLGVCDRIAVLAGGVLGSARPVSEWDEHALMAAATA